MFLRSTIAAGALLLASCAAPEPEPRAPPAEPALAAPSADPAAGPPPPSLAAGQAEFGVALYRGLAARPGNLFLSPAGISTALGMVHAGAQGETAAEMAQALRYPASGAHEGMADLLRRLPIAAEGRRLDIANALWVQQSFPLKPGFLELVRSHYGGGARGVDFVAEPERAIATVNRWAEEKTAGRIKGILRPENVNDRTRLVLTNAVYFKADWLYPFQAAQTRPRPFRLADGGTVMVPTMRQRGRFRLFETPSFEAVEMPYKGEELSFILFLPKEGTSLKAFEQQLEGKALGGWIDRVRESERHDLSLVVPKLELETRASLVPQLQALGIRRVFTQAAQLGGIADAGLYLSDVLHQTYLRVDEKGTEAAAVTAGLAEIVSMPRLFQADRPFFFVIRDNRSGTLIFIGRIERPSPLEA
ncbi:MAG TPA: serpin family protein [Allosphingosinicella sp.]|nr:serpin family protein [Allosphingosinicella sp.]